MIFHIFSVILRLEETKYKTTMNKKELPVLLLTGYLGSGKTTLLNRILTNKKGIKFAVVVNDIGEVNIDANLIQQGGVVNQKDDSLVALQNGCICCTLKMDLVEQLKDIAAMQRFDYIVIEASGICEPAPIAQTICSIPTLGPEYTKDAILRLDSIVTVVDALRMRDEFGSGEALTSQNIGEEDIENLVIQQIEFCNTILLNKASEVSAEELEKIKQIIRALQPKAEIIPCDYGDVDLDKLVNTHGFDFDAVATSAAWIDEIEHHHEDDDDDDDDEEEHHHHHHDDDDDNEEEHHHHHHDDDDDDDEAHTTIITTPTTMKAAKWKSMALAVLCIMPANLSTSTTSIILLRGSGPRALSAAKASAGLSMSPTAVMCLSRQAARWDFREPVNGMLPCPKTSCAT